ncbi:DUF72 domain-containing protein [Lewinella sp. 4G2]|uniref:DUF72 domain-containing protein n=1 Tax=Lewinella sp. 4G2 TaxID=1803372 RepID=UPI0007B4CB96|nr:DUF72 domain-containing protein [Lewinella sp. 4G2]OAV45230.1 hypothetical protein A3850_012320 [Lewinella sp. 4G2]
MKFGAAVDLSKVNFEFPIDPLANRARLDRFELGPTEGKPRIYLGATGWSMREWVGKWYPKGTKSAEYLREYGKQFNTIELNTTHYRIPDADLVRRWVEAVPADFRFCPKLPQHISHRTDFGHREGHLTNFVAALDGMGEKMGCAFAQLPPYFDYARLDQLKVLLSRWPRLLPLAVELRHESWFADPFVTEELMDTLAAHGTAAVITDVSGRRDVLHNYVTAPRAMVRFVGNGLVTSDYERLKVWGDKLREWNLPETYFFPHEPENVLAPDASAWFAGHLREMGFAEVRGPVDLSGLGQQSLF